MLDECPFENKLLTKLCNYTVFYVQMHAQTLLLEK